MMKMTCNDINEQESDRMERLEMPCLNSQTDAELDAIPLVSLGCSCGPKLSFKSMGRGAETLPFDWVRTRVTGVLQFLSSRFEGFYDYDSSFEVPVQMASGKQHMTTVFRGSRHSFWHDDPTSPAMHERYDRRIARFLQMDASSRPVLFVRTVATTDEIPKTDRLVAALKALFGEKVRLLLIIDFQDSAQAGAYTVSGLEENLLLYYLDTANAESRSAPYCGAIRLGLHWAAGRHFQLLQVLPDLNRAHLDAKPHHHLLYGYGECEAFEGITCSRRNSEDLSEQISKFNQGSSSQ